MADLLANQIFEDQFGGLRHIEGRLASGDTNLGSNSVSQSLQALALLKECVYIFRLQLRLGEPLINSDYRYSILKGEFPDVCNKLIRTITSNGSYNVLVGIANEVRAFHKELTELAKKTSMEPDSKWQNEATALRRQVADYEKSIAELQTKAEAASNAVSTVRDFVEVKTAKEWTDDYLLYVQQDDSSRRKINSLLSANKKRQRNASKLSQTISVKMDAAGISIYKLYRLFVRDVVFYNGTSYVNAVKKWRFWRSMWLSVLFALSIIYASLFWNYDVQTKGVGNFVLEKSAFLPLLIVVSLGFSFCARNYKINAHLLEQYKHRYVVAKTMQNLMLLDDLKGNENVRSGLIQEGSKILFEFRNAGYMSKNDPSDLPSMKDLLNSGIFKHDQ